MTRTPEEKGTGRRRLAGAVRRILAEHASPAELGLSVALGVFVACTPFYGLQTLLALGAAWLLGLNRLVAVTSAQVSFAPVSPFLIFGSIQAGELILHGRLMPLAPAAWHGAGLVRIGRTVIAAWLVGGAVLGVVLGGLLGGAVYAVARRRQGRGPLRGALRRAASRYAAAPPRVRWYARIKYATDPAYVRVAEALASLAPGCRRRILDLGCGVGMLGVLLGEAELDAAVTGVDWDGAKLGWARMAAQGLPRVTFAAADLIEDPLPPADCAVLLDVLHYHPVEVQEALLARVARAVSPQGAVLVREADAGRHRWLPRAGERLGAALGWHRTAGRFHYRGSDELAGTLERLGFSVRVVPAGNVAHRANVLLVAVRGEDGTRVQE